ncbi:MAG: hydantoinase B/oxoprolinase family protein, partial [Dehalococcoidales bacterium]|nr:hydantoinase B/oxoprolinase family protein [Dehalococcoidales bacterium]
WNMFAPVFYHGELVAWVVNKCHLVDLGAHIPSTDDAYAKDIYEEGLHLPGLRLCRNHEMITDIIRCIAYNFRYSRQWYGDFLAQLGSLWIGEKRLIELCDRFGYEVVKACLKEVLRYGDRMMTSEIKKLPRVTVKEEMLSEKFDEFCPQGLKLKLKLSIDPDKALITYDYRNMPDQLPWGYNLTYATSNSSAIQGTLPMLDPSMPINDGVTDHIKVLLREGSVAGIPRWPVGTSAATVSLCDEVTNLVFKAWSKVLPDRALAGMGEYCAANFFGSGVDIRNNEPYSHVYYLAASAAGATKGYDGLSHMFGHCIMGNMGYEFIETVELAIPNIVWGTYAIQDSGGPGKWRGGIAVGHTIQPRDHSMLLIYCGTSHTCAPFGLFGGLSGSLADHWIVEHDSGTVIKHLGNAGMDTCNHNQEWVAYTGGGGGFGNPLDRDPEKVRDDVRDGFVSMQAAKEIYKVVINDHTEMYEVDIAATKKIRAKAKRGSKNGL